MDTKPKTTKDRPGLTDDEFAKWLLLQDNDRYFLETDDGPADGWRAQVRDRNGRVIASAAHDRRDMAQFAAIRAAIGVIRYA